MSYSVREMDEILAEGVSELEKRCFSVPWSRSSIECEVGRENALWLAAVTPGNNVIGYVGTQTVLDETSVMNVATAPEFRGKGVASRLLSELFKRLPASNVFYLEVRESNAEAIRLYEKFGFKKISVRKNYYEKPAENAIIMAKNNGVR